MTSLSQESGVIVATVGAVLPDNYGIILGKASGSGVSNDGTLRFRNGKCIIFSD